MKGLWKSQPFWGKYSDRNVERIGRKDGSLDPPIPPWDAPVLPPFLWELVQAGDSDIQLLKQGWSAEDKDLLPEWQAKAHEDVRSQTEADRAHTALGLAELAYKAAHGGEPLPTDRRFGLYRLANAALSLAEIPFNAIVFRSVGESEAMTVGFTAALAITVVGCAHFLGVYLRRLRDRTGRIVRKHAAFVALLVAIPMGVIGSIAWFRAEYLALPKAAITSSSSRSASGLPLPAHNLSPAHLAQFAVLPTLCSFFLFNLVLFLLATVYSYHVHDEWLAIVYRCRAERHTAQKARARAHRALVRVRGRREKRHTHYQGLGHQIGKNVKRLIEAYRTHNLQTRGDRGDHAGKYPNSFDKYGGIDMPNELKTLDWPADPAAASALSAASTNAPSPIGGEVHSYEPTQEKELQHVRNGHSPTGL